MKDKIYPFHVDPGHGWLEVEYSDLVELGIQDEISECSYRRGNTCYLEEDCDAYLFVHTYNGRFGKNPEEKEVSHDLPDYGSNNRQTLVTRQNAECFIRKLPRYYS